MFLRRIARPLMMMARVKETTGIVGLDVVPNAREVLINLYRKTLEEIKAVPEDEGYRKAVESFTRHRLSVCQEEEDSEMIEKRLGCGQVEELIEEAQDELKLIGHMNGPYSNKLLSSIFTSYVYICICVRLYVFLFFGSYLLNAGMKVNFYTIVKHGKFFSFFFLFDYTY
ncbi:hypothetical protein HAX54_005756 [Datura stramonium]|uniref:Uncharacterized protein n=1 Tax=Datura stramonium TaxID=4076 RepID=A0ABS8TAH0_DATST|nr:hypothetical protein [Datura stramonium]